MTMRAQFSCHLSASLKKENQGEVEQIGLQSYGRLPSANVQLLPPSFSKGRTRRERCWWDASSAVHQGADACTGIARRRTVSARCTLLLHGCEEEGTRIRIWMGIGGPTAAWACLHGTLIGALITPPLHPKLGAPTLKSGPAVHVSGRPTGPAR